MALIWIVEDHAPLRRGLAAALALPPHRHEALGFESCEEALRVLAAQAAPAVMLLDVGLPGMDGIEGISHFKRLAPQTAILVLTVFEDDDKIFRAVCAGASGYLLKAQPIAHVVEAVAQALAGGSPMNPRVANRVLAMFAKLVPAKKEFGLNEREQAVLRCIAAGLTRKQIPGATQLNPHTADYVMRSIYKKLHVNCAAAAVSVAVREHLIDDPPPKS
jgi:DNA-binding NarL/FixJ family response regulator